MTKCLLIASNNPKKLAELRTLLMDLPVELKTLRDYPDVREVVEDGRTFRENAKKKALACARQSGCLTLADDSGLVVDYLKGAPGVYSARFAGPEKDDLKNCEKVLEQMTHAEDSKRGAAFRCAVALATPQRVVSVVEEEVRGYITRTMRGRGGFGYDPLFFYPEFGKTFAEIPAEQKHTVSHRGKALRKMKVVLSRYLKSEK
ncbi:MAG TPA: XTP/dITP diphosphatase [Candidatus Paceibacterota bacterium]|nr:MAG: non-canonical purine NTP pyrophosphatase, RdgB/HAM1 family [Omnitrophica bacterium RIFCSPLOWO2_01_FULL_50_24]HXK31376.1 XTP/dITP diphosphatase [Candidatus Paceibacterota bacterium]